MRCPYKYNQSLYLRSCLYLNIYQCGGNFFFITCLYSIMCREHCWAPLLASNGVGINNFPVEMLTNFTSYSMTFSQFSLWTTSDTWFSLYIFFTCDTLSAAARKYSCKDIAWLACSI